VTACDVVKLDGAVLNRALASYHVPSADHATTSEMFGARSRYLLLGQACHVGFWGLLKVLGDVWDWTTVVDEGWVHLMVKERGDLGGLPVDDGRDPAGLGRVDEDILAV
jgi:hypothetical protein